MTNSQKQNKKNSSIVVSSISPQEVQLRPAPVWSRALAWTIISTASFGFIFAIFAKIGILSQLLLMRRKNWHYGTRLIMTREFWSQF